MGRPVSSGQRQKLSALEFNSQRESTAFAAAAATRPAPQFKTPPITDLIQVRNETGAARDVFDVVAFYRTGSNIGPTVTPSQNLPEFQRHAVLRAKLPNGPGNGEYKNDIGRFAILLQPLAENAIGWAQVSGICRVKVNMIHAEHCYADIKDDDATQLESGEVGAAEIFWQEGEVDEDEGKGTKWAVVRLGNFVAPPLLARIDERRNFRRMRSREFVRRAGQHPTGRTITAYSRFFTRRRSRSTISSNYLTTGGTANFSSSTFATTTSTRDTAKPKPPRAKTGPGICARWGDRRPARLSGHATRPPRRSSLMRRGVAYAIIGNRRRFRTPRPPVLE
jgi:hypothetical protein